MHQSFYIDGLQFHKQAEAGHRGNDAVKLFSHMILQELALEPGLDVAGGIIRPALGHGTVHAVSHHVALVIGEDIFPGHERRTALAYHGLGAHLGANDVADAPVHQQVRIAADRRGEVGIGRIVEAEVTLVLRLVHRLAQGAQQHGLNDVDVVAGLHFIQQLAVVGRGRLVAAAQVQAQLAQEAPQVLQLFRSGALVHPVQHRQLVLFIEARGGHVGAQHALFDNLVGVIAHHRHNGVDLALLIEQDAGFSGLEINRPAVTPGAAQHFVQ